MIGLFRGTSSNRSGLIMILAAASFWGTAAMAAKLLFRTTDIDAFIIGFFRLALAVPVLTLAGWKFRRDRDSPITLKARSYMALVGVFLAASHVSYYQAIKYVGVSITALVACPAMPLLVVVISMAAGREKLNFRLAVSLFLALGGVGLLIGGPHSVYPWPLLIKGGLLSLGAALFLALVTLTSRQLAAHYNPMSMSTLATAAAALILSPIIISRGLSFSYGPEGWLLLIYMGVVPTAVAYTIYFAGLRQVKASAASILTLAEPFTAVLLACLFFGERLSAMGWGGAAMLIGSFLMICREK